MVFLGMGFGVTKESWYPDPQTTGRNYELPTGLRSLEPYKNDFSIIQNAFHQYSRDGHAGSTFWLTGANQYAVPGQSFHNTVSVDQVAAEYLGQDTRFESVRLNGTRVGRSNDGHGPGLSLSWDKQGKPMSAWSSPLETYHRLFSNDDTPIDVRREELAAQRSILDTVLLDANSLRQEINPTDRDKLDEYFESVRDIELRLAKEQRWLGVEKEAPEMEIAQPDELLEGVEEIRVIYDLMVAAMQADASRVFTYRMPGDTMLASLGAGISVHNMSHYAFGERKNVSEQRDQTHAQLLAEFFGKLKDSNEPDGSTLFDNTVVSFGSNISNIHSLMNCPTLVAGGGAGFSQGQHIVMEDARTPLCNVWLSLLQGIGMNVESHGDSTGIIEELF